MITYLINKYSTPAVSSGIYQDRDQTQKSVLTINSASTQYEGVYRCVADFGNSATAESGATSLVIYSKFCYLQLL